jgi:Na+-transporting methylmalonyl-CoA/oxaloacetate decarboxylase gamma subunit
MFYLPESIMKKFISVLASAIVLALPLSVISTPAAAQAPATAAPAKAEKAAPAQAEKPAVETKKKAAAKQKSKQTAKKKAAKKTTAS